MKLSNHARGSETRRTRKQGSCRTVYHCGRTRDSNGLLGASFLAGSLRLAATIGEVRHVGTEIVLGGRAA